MGHCHRAGESAPRSFPVVATVDELRESRERINQAVVKAVKELPFSEDILPQTLTDSEQHVMTPPRALQPDDLLSKTLTRRIPVREERVKGWRTRVVHHETESGVNLATVPVDKIRHHSLDILSEIVMAFYRRNCEVQLWKRDVSQAFRRVPIQASRSEFAWTVWSNGGVLLTAQHIGIPVGTVSAVYLWHRVGFFLAQILLHMFKCPVARYVDDFFRAGRKGLRYSAGKILSVICTLLGFPTDDAKDADDTLRMVCLGAEVEAWFATRQLKTRVKAVKYKRVC